MDYCLLSSILKRPKGKASNKFGRVLGLKWNVLKKVETMKEYTLKMLKISGHKIENMKEKKDEEGKSNKWLIWLTWDRS